MSVRLVNSLTIRSYSICIYNFLLTKSNLSNDSFVKMTKHILFSSYSYHVTVITKFEFTLTKTTVNLMK